MTNKLVLRVHSDNFDDKKIFMVAKLALRVHG